MPARNLILRGFLSGRSCTFCTAPHWSVFPVSVENDML